MRVRASGRTTRTPAPATRNARVRGKAGTRANTTAPSTAAVAVAPAIRRITAAAADRPRRAGVAAVAGNSIATSERVPAAISEQRLFAKQRGGRARARPPLAPPQEWSYGVDGGAGVGSEMNGTVDFFGGTQLSFSPGRSSQRQSAGRKMMAAIMLTMNMKVSITPMSAWNFSAENTQVPT